MLRNVSTYTRAKARTSPFDERRATPTTTPITLAAMIPMSVTLSVLTIPTQIALAVGVARLVGDPFGNGKARLHPEEPIARSQGRARPCREPCCRKSRARTPSTAARNTACSARRRTRTSLHRPGGPVRQKDGGRPGGLRSGQSITCLFNSLPLGRHELERPVLRTSAWPGSLHRDRPCRLSSGRDRRRGGRRPSTAG